MATKTISLRLDAYEKLRQARRSPSESFTDVVLRATWPEKSVTGAELLEIYRKHGPFFSEEGLRIIEELKADDRPPEDKWHPTPAMSAGPIAGFIASSASGAARSAPTISGSPLRLLSTARPW
jgi:predicted CopG family antitoxin